MKCHVNFKRLDHSQSLVDYANERLQKLERFEWKPANLHLTISKQKHLVRAEISAMVADMKFHSSVRAHDFQSAVDQAVDKIGKQIARKKAKLQNRRNRSPLPESVLELSVKQDDEFSGSDYDDHGWRQVG